MKLKDEIYDLVDKVEELLEVVFYCSFSACPTNAPSPNILELQKFIKTMLFTNVTGTEFVLILESDLGLPEIRSLFKIKFMLT